MKYYYYCFLVVVGLLVLEIVAHVFTKARELNEKEEACREEAEMDDWLGILSACYHHATRTLKETHGIYLCALSQCCWMLRNGQMCDKKVAILALKGLGYWDNAEELEEKMEGGKTDYTFHQIDTTVEDVLERRLEKKKQGSQADTVADESTDEAENKHVTSWILFFGGLILFLVGLSYGRAISAYTNDSMLDYVIMWVGMFLMVLPSVYAAKKWELEAR